MMTIVTGRKNTIMSAEDRSFMLEVQFRVAFVTSAQYVLDCLELKIDFTSEGLLQ